MEISENFAGSPMSQLVPNPGYDYSYMDDTNAYNMCSIYPTMDNGDYWNYNEKVGIQTLCSKRGLWLISFELANIDSQGSFVLAKELAE
ncbi:hypothetical protein TKK_0009658 [Trichogramma kaykai]|uniref:Uncharacterized protein n=1 Tax=Trichogramma kaykai TaxID=54128 RepID=A0ABD2X024_9HYME